MEIDRSKHRLEAADHSEEMDVRTEAAFQEVLGALREVTGELDIYTSWDTPHSNVVRQTAEDILSHYPTAERGEQ